MLKVMLADLDFENISNFRAYIRKNFPIFQIVKPALSIGELDRNIKEYEPDIIIIEMRFFGTGMVQSFKNLNNSYPDIKLIIYGSINDSDYMKKCLEYGAVSYIYRPVKPSELARCLNAAIDIFEKKKIIDEKQKQIMKRYQNEMSVFELKFLSALTSGQLSNELEIEASLEYFDIELKAPYTAALLRIDHFKKIVLALEEKEKHLLIFGMLEVINNMLETGKAFINNFNEIIILLSGFSELDDIIDFFNSVKEEITKESRLDISIGIGRSVEELSNLNISSNEAKAALRYRCIVGYNSIIPIEYVEPDNRITYSYPIEREELLVYTAVIGEYNYCVKLLDELMTALEKSGNISRNLISQIIMDILISINRNAAEQGLKINGINKFFPTPEVLRLENVEQASDFMKRGLKELCEFVTNLREKSQRKIFESAVKYINENFYENLSSAKMAQMLRCSAEYFKRLFFQYAEKPFIEYLTYKRIEEAKKLIMETTFSDDAIAIKVGFDDISLFRSTFKRLEGYMVSDFRYINNRNFNNVIR